MVRKFDPSVPGAVRNVVEGVASRRLPLVPSHIVPIGTRFVRIFGIEHKDPRGVGRGPSRFSDPRFGTCVKGECFSILYAARSLGTAFEEVVLRDETDGETPPHPITRQELARWQVVILETTRPLHLVDAVNSEGWRRMGMPTDAVRGSGHRLSRLYSLGFHRNNVFPDGILYPSRFSGEANIALYDRAIKVSCRVASGPSALLDIELRDVFNRLGLVIVDPEPNEDDDVTP